MNVAYTKSSGVGGGGSTSQMKAISIPAQDLSALKHAHADSLLHYTGAIM